MSSVQLVGCCVEEPEVLDEGLSLVRISLVTDSAPPMVVPVVASGERGERIRRRARGSRLVIFGNLVQSRGGGIAVEAKWVEWAGGVRAA